MGDVWRWQGVQPPTMDRERSEPKVWLPGEGWVVVQPAQHMQEAGYAADSEDQLPQHSEPDSAPTAASGRQADDQVRCCSESGTVAR